MLARFSTLLCLACILPALVRHKANVAARLDANGGSRS